MGICAFLAPDRIPLDIVTADVMSEIERGEAVAALQEVSLVTLETLDDGSAGISVHRLVQEVMRGRLASGQVARSASGWLAHAPRDGGWRMRCSHAPDEPCDDYATLAAMREPPRQSHCHSHVVPTHRSPRDRVRRRPTRRSILAPHERPLPTL